MHLQFGNLYKLHRIVYFRISPYEQKIFKGMISEGLPNLARRIDGCVYRFAPQFIGTYLLYHWANEENHKLHRKNPKDFEDDTTDKPIMSSMQTP